MLSNQYFLVKISRDTYQKYEEFILEHGRVIYTGIDGEFKDNEELKELADKIKELRDKKENLLTKLRQDEI